VSVGKVDFVTNFALLEGAIRLERVQIGYPWSQFNPRELVVYKGTGRSAGRRRSTAPPPSPSRRQSERYYSTSFTVALTWLMLLLGCKALRLSTPPFFTKKIHSKKFSVRAFHSFLIVRPQDQ